MAIRQFHPAPADSKSLSKPAGSTRNTDGKRGHKPAGAHSFQNGETNALDSCVLALVKELNGRVGRTTIALILLGSKAKKITEKRLHEIEHYGRFRGYKEEGLLDHIDGLIEDGAVKITTGLYPKVLLTESGQSRLDRG